ncbi:MAG: MauE/DoxX family redox-associated membrane protein [bacterium]
MTALRVLVAVTLALSALLKLFDFAAVAILFAMQLGLPDAIARNLLGGLVIVELAAAILLLLPEPRLPKLYPALVVLFSTFLGATLWLGLKGSENCGCFGTLIPMTPLASALKNVGLIVATLVLWRHSANVRRVALT